MEEMKFTSCLKTDARYFSLILFELSSPVTDQMYMYNQVVKNMPIPIASRYKALCPESVFSRAWASDRAENGSRPSDTAVAVTPNSLND